MLGRHSDKRPRVLDFSTRIDGTAARRDLAWPCHAFRVTIPVRSGGGLNVFEETILKLLADARRDITTLADLTCLNLDLVTLVCCRLRDLGMLTPHNDLSEDGRAYLSKIEADCSGYQVRFVFREMVGGNLLPVVYGGELQYEDLLEWQRTGVRIRRTSRKGEAETTGPFLRLVQGRELGRGPKPPNVREFLWAMERHRALNRQYSMLRAGVEPCPSVRHVGEMSIDPSPERVFLRCRICVPARSTDFRLADPFGYGFSDILERAYRELLTRDNEEEQFVLRMKEQAIAVRPFPAPLTSTKGKAEATKAVLQRLAECVTDYPDVFYKLRKAEEDFGRCKSKPRSGDEESHFAYYGQQAAQSYCEVLESTLGLVVSRFGVPVREAILCSQTHEDNGVLLKEIAARVGFATQRLGSLLHVPAGRILRLREGAVDLQALLALALVGAESDDAHPLRRVAADDVDWLLFVQKLKVARGSGAHGTSREAGLRKMEWLRERAFRSIEMLLPEVKKAGPVHESEGTIRESHTGAIAEERLIARTALERSLGIQAFSILDAEVAELFLQVEIKASSFQLEAVKKVEVARQVTDLASILQRLIHARLPMDNGTELEGASVMPLARTKAVEAGFMDDQEELPRSLSTVRISLVNSALQGKNSTLGACVLALLLTSPIEDLRELRTRSQRLLSLCVRLLVLREHGNKPIWMSPREFLDMKNEVIDACKVLMEA